MAYNEDPRITERFLVFEGGFVDGRAPLRGSPARYAQRDQTATRLRSRNGPLLADHLDAPEIRLLTYYLALRTVCRT